MWACDGEGVEVFDAPEGFEEFALQGFGEIGGCVLVRGVLVIRVLVVRVAEGEREAEVDVLPGVRDVGVEPMLGEFCEVFDEHDETYGVLDMVLFKAWGGDCGVQVVDCEAVDEGGRNSDYGNGTVDADPLFCFDERGRDEDEGVQTVEEGGGFDVELAAGEEEGEGEGFVGECCWGGLAVEAGSFGDGVEEVAEYLFAGLERDGEEV